jgi:hypothetical protein
LARVRDAWRRGLEGWNVLQSEQVLGWQAMAAAETRIATTRDHLLRLLQLPFPGPLPQDLMTTLQTTSDLDKLDHWVDAAVTVPSLEAFRAAVQS